MSFITHFFNAYSESNMHKRNRLAELNGPFLFSSERLDSLRNEFSSKDDQMQILDHLYRFDACEVDSYKKVEDRIIERWR